MIARIALVLTILASPVFAGEGAAADGEPRLLRPSVLRSWDHDPEIYTQGLIFEDGVLFESSGRYGRSLVRRWKPPGGPQVEHRLDDRLFAEGLAKVGERLLLLTWREEEVLVLDADTLERVGGHSFRGEGWGLCWDGRELWMSDGTATLSRRDSRDFTELGRVEVTLRGSPLENLNELECAEGWIYANVYQSDLIVQIEPTSGRVAATIDASRLLRPSQRRKADVLNGIAYDPARESFYLTGKLWPKIFEVVFVEP